MRLKSNGRLTCFYCGKSGHFQKNCRHFQKDKGRADGAKPKKISKRSGTSKEELLLITEKSKVHLVSDEMTWVVDSRRHFT